MGMFDWITVAAPHNEAIDERVRDKEFQTKDLENALLYYRVDSEGHLLEESDTKQQTVVNYHGDIYFYTSYGSRFADDYEWMEYRARFTEGALTKIERINKE